MSSSQMQMQSTVAIETEVNVVNCSSRRRKNMKRLSCRKCERHGISSYLKGHAAQCPFNNCKCNTCGSVMQLRASALVRRFRHRQPNDSTALLKTIRSKNGNMRLRIIAKNGRSSPTGTEIVYNASTSEDEVKSSSPTHSSNSNDSSSESSSSSSSSHFFNPPFATSSVSLPQSTTTFQSIQDILYYLLLQQSALLMPSTQSMTSIMMPSYLSQLPVVNSSQLSPQILADLCQQFQFPSFY